MTPSELANKIAAFLDTQTDLDISSVSVLPDEDNVIGIDQHNGPMLLIEVNLA